MVVSHVFFLFVTVWSVIALGTQSCWPCWRRWGDAASTVAPLVRQRWCQLPHKKLLASPCTRQVCLVHSTYPFQHQPPRHRPRLIAWPAAASPRPPPQAGARSCCCFLHCGTGGMFPCQRSSSPPSFSPSSWTPCLWMFLCIAPLLVSSPFCLWTLAHAVGCCELSGSRRGMGNIPGWHLWKLAQHSKFKAIFQRNWGQPGLGKKLSGGLLWMLVLLPAPVPGRGTAGWGYRLQRTKASWAVLANYFGIPGL